MNYLAKQKKRPAPTYPPGTPGAPESQVGSPSRKKKGGGNKAAPKPAAAKKGGGYLGKNFDPNAPLTGKSAKGYLNAATRMEFDPLKRQLQSEQMASQHREGTEIPSWFAAYQGQLAQLRGETQGAYDTALAKTQGVSEASGQQDASNRAAVMERLQADAQMRGTSVDPSLDIGQADAEAARMRSRDSTYGTIAGQGANNYKYLSDRIGTAGLSGIEARQSEGRRRGKITADQRELAGKEGDYRVELLQDLIDKERQYSLERKATKLDSQKAGEDARHNRAGEANTVRGQNVSRKNAQGTQRGQNKRQEDDQAYDKREAKKDRRADKNKAKND